MTPECGLLVGPMGVLGLMRLAGDLYREELWGPRRPGHGPAAAGSAALQCSRQSSTGHCRERGGEEESGDSNLPHRRTCSADQPTATLCLHSSPGPGVPYYANVLEKSELVIGPVSHALAPLSAHIHWKGKGFIGNVWRGH